MLQGGNASMGELTWNEATARDQNRFEAIATIRQIKSQSKARDGSEELKLEEMTHDRQQTKPNQSADVNQLLCWLITISNASSCKNCVQQLRVVSKNGD